jgi:hypothetical protein
MFEGYENDGIWMVQNQQHPNFLYKLQSPFTEYESYSCEWAICGNLCKHQVIVLLSSIDIIKENIIVYCGTWFGFNCEGLKTMFIDPWYLQLDDGASNDEDNEGVQVEK